MWSGRDDGATQDLRGDEFGGLDVGGHEKLPGGGQGNSPVADMRIPRMATESPRS